MSIKLVGILNVTPDSFSDGGEYESPEVAIAKARALYSSGADIVDIGAQSTGPNSRPIGLQEELLRLERIVPALTNEMPISVDTYRAEVAEWSINSGAKIINDITAGSDPGMFRVIAANPVKIILMYSPMNKAHDFTHLSKNLITPSNVMDLIVKFFKERIEVALSSGVKEDQIIIDPGMGAFLSSDPNVSWEVINRFAELRTFSLPLMLACSRKGFLKVSGENSPKDRDPISALVGAYVAEKSGYLRPDFIRTHNPSMQRDFLRLGNDLTS